MIRSLVICVVAVLMLPACGWGKNIPAPDVEGRVDHLLNQLTLDEKLKLLSGINSRFIRGIARLGIPEMKMSDGPVGAHNDGPDTAYPSTIALAASFDKDLAERFGKSIGSDCRARGVNFLLGPAMNIYRVPVCGRNSEYLGEDPYLAGTMAGQIVTGLQSEGVAATMKHYAANNQEDHRGSVSVEADDRTLREIYLRHFEIAVRQAHPWAIMAAYNCINGEHCTANHWLETDTLKNEWGFEGLVMSDWGATHDTLGPANAGLDLEMPGGHYFIPDKLMPLIKDGKISQATIDDKVRRILRVEVSLEFLDRPQQDKSIPLDDPHSAATALQIAREGAVLLKNDGDLLPLDRAKTKTLVVIGPNADPAVVGCGGSSQVEPFHSVSVLAGLRNVAGAGVNVIFIPTGDRQQLDNLCKHSIYQLPRSNAPGLRVQYFANKELKGKPMLSRTATTIDGNWNEQNPPPPGLEQRNFSVRWAGRIVAPADGEYTFALGSHEGARLFINNKQIIDLWSGHPFKQVNTNIHLDAGKTYRIRVEFYSGWGESSVQFGWGPAQPILNSSEKEQIASADAAVICVGFDPLSESEGYDRPYALPAEQNDLINMVSKMNHRSIVLVNAGGNVDMNPWIGNVPALLQAWYPGQEGGTALAEILFGDVNPSGHLPATFEKRFEDCPAFSNYPGKDDKVYYKEGIFVGYRYYDAKNVEPRFAFGYGLSYTTFAFSDLKIKPTLPDGQEFEVTVRVTNMGHRAGSDAAQFYVGQDDPSLPRPVRWLVGFQKVSLLPGESKTCRVMIDPTSLCYWDSSLHHWKVDAGGYHVWAGDSSRSLPTSAEFTYR